MAVQAKTKTGIDAADFKQAMLDNISELWDEHQDQIEAIRGRAEGQTISVTFGNTIDGSESTPTICTKIRFCETYTDERTKTITRDDKNQLKMETIEHAGRGGRNNEPAADVNQNQE